MPNVYEDIVKGNLKFEDFQGIELVAYFENDDYDYTEMPIFRLKKGDYSKENLKKEMRKNCMEIFYGFHNHDNIIFRILQDHVSWESWIPLLDINMVFTLLDDILFRRDLETYHDFLEWRDQYKHHHSEKMIDVFEELMEKTWHPSRALQWCM